jgi:hypothetical protein
MFLVPEDLAEDQELTAAPLCEGCHTPRASSGERLVVALGLAMVLGLAAAPGAAQNAATTLRGRLGEATPTASRRFEAAAAQAAV